MDLVSKELTTMTLATLFDFPFDERRKLTHWSDTMTTATGFGPVATAEEAPGDLDECFAYFTRLWNQRVNAAPAGDLISMLAHGADTRDMSEAEFHANVTLLIIGGNDTTRNTISGSVYALNQNPDQYDRLRADPGLIPSMVSETIRWQTPLAHMARTALEDVEFRGKLIRKGERVVMWYVSGNRDDEVIERPNDYIIDRATAAPAPVVRLRHPPLRRQPAGRAAADHHLGRDHEALPGNPPAGRAEAQLLDLREGL